MAKAASRGQTPDALSPQGRALSRKEAGTWQKTLGRGQPELGCSSGVTATCLSSRVPASCSRTFQAGISLQAGSVGFLNEKLLLADSGARPGVEWHLVLRMEPEACLLAGPRRLRARQESCPCCPPT